MDARPAWNGDGAIEQAGRDNRVSRECITTASATLTGTSTGTASGTTGPNGTGGRWAGIRNSRSRTNAGADVDRAHLDRTERLTERKPRVRLCDGMIEGIRHLQVGDEASHPTFGAGWIVHSLNLCGTESMALLIRVQIPTTHYRQLPQLPTIEQLIAYEPTAIGWVVTNRWGGKA